MLRMTFPRDRGRMGLHLNTIIPYVCRRRRHDIYCIIFVVLFTHPPSRNFLEISLGAALFAFFLSTLLVFVLNLPVYVYLYHCME